MVKVIMGLKGSGKTKQLVDLVTAAAEAEPGNIVCIERKPQLTYDLPHSVRLVAASDYSLVNYDALRGFVCGMHAGNYDITHIYIDNLFKIVDRPYDAEAEAFIEWCVAFSEKEGVNFTMTLSADVALASDKVKALF
ncbi:MAG: hypothetical protein MJ075_00125 [Oscillospiraceae bacterium]|nr:hypothetical protein [Oscillospiraceae bacterium]